VGAVDARARSLEPGELGPHVIVDRLVDQRERGREPVFAGVERRCQPPVGAETAEGEDRAPAATLGVGDQPLELAHLVAAPAPGAEASVFLHPNAEAGQLTHRRRALGQHQVRQGLGEDRKTFVQPGGHRCRVNTTVRLATSPDASIALPEIISFALERRCNASRPGRESVSASYFSLGSLKLTVLV
jgi:hypothetical protein